MEKFNFDKLIKTFTELCNETLNSKKVLNDEFTLIIENYVIEVRNYPYKNDNFDDVFNSVERDICLRHKDKMNFPPVIAIDFVYMGAGFYSLLNKPFTFITVNDSESEQIHDKLKEILNFNMEW